MAEQARVLAVGAAGAFAGMVVPELIKRGARVRALIKDKTDEGAVRAKGAHEIAVGDLSDPSSLTEALRGIQRMFYVAPAFSRDEVGMGIGVVNAASKAGVCRFVFSAVIHPILGDLENHHDKAPVEEAAISSAMEWTFLHPARVMQDHDQLWPLLEKGELAEPYKAEQPMSWVDYRKVAEVAALALTEDGLVDGTFDLCARGTPDCHAVASLASSALGRKVKATTPAFDHWAEQLGLQQNEHQRAGRKAMFDWYDAHPLLGNPLILTAILKREPRSLNDYFKELVSRHRMSD